MGIIAYMNIPKQIVRVKDKQGRTLIEISPEGKVAVARFPNMTPSGIQKVIDICKAIMIDNSDLAMDLEGIRKFLAFESDEDEFCS